LKKPYSFVPYNSKVERAQIVGRDRMRSDLYHGKIVLRIEALTQMLVSTGELDYVGDQIMKGVQSRQGRPVIPGSSIKGMSRTHAEMMSYACNMSKIPRVLKEHASEPNKSCSGGKNDPTKAEVCVCCRMFGFVGDQKKKCVQKGLLEFSEFILQGDPSQWTTTAKIPQLYAPLRKVEAKDLYLSDEDYLQKKVYKHGTPQQHKGTTYQVVRAGAQFVGEIVFLNLSKSELALFILSLGAAEGKRRFQSKLGYAKPAFFGSVQVDVLQVQPYNRPFLRNGQPITRDDLLFWADQYPESGEAFLSEQIEKLVEHYQYARDKDNQWSVNHRGQKGY